jgi:tetratricopeptide (TPR) repeat protein
MMVAMGLVVVTFWLLRDWLRDSLLPPALRPPTNLQAAQAAFDNGDLDLVITIALELYNTNPRDLAALELLVRALVYRSYSDYDTDQDRQTALTLTTAAFYQQPDHLSVMALHAFVLQANQASPEAARLALRVIEKDPQNLPARVALALAYGSQGIFEAALREARRAVELADTLHPAWRTDARRALAIAYSDLGRYRDAITAVREAIDLNRGLLLLHFERALYSIQIGDNDNATAAYFRVIAFDATNAKARLRLCELSSTMRERDLAIRYCHETTQVAPQWSIGWYQLGRQYFLKGSYTEAQSALRQCSTLQVLQNVPIAERQLECWYIQGQSAELVGDCVGLTATYNEFLAMMAGSDLPQTWTYPPEGPTICLTPTPPR